MLMQFANNLNVCVKNLYDESIIEGISYFFCNEKVPKGFTRLLMELELITFQ